VSGPATPYLALDDAALERNLAAMAARCARAGTALRPHVKGHKAPAIAARQLAHGAAGVAVSTVDEAAVMHRAGVRDVLLTTPPAPRRVEDVAALDGVACVVHGREVVAELGAAAAARGRPIRVLLDVDVGQRRGGLPDPDAAVDAGRAAQAAAGLELLGVQGYDGHLQGIADPAARAVGHAEAMARLDAVLDALAAAGLPTGWVTSAGTGTCELALATSRVTEVQPGSYAVMDAAYARVGGVAFEQAVHVATSVLAVLGPRELIVDAGWKSMSTDAGAPQVAGRDARWEPAGDEHGRVTGELEGLRRGDELLLVPSHADTTIDLYDALHPAGGGAPIAVAARSRGGVAVAPGR
jgi:D-serine deaminase-like pyridoxal phosphate-dependent protein